MKRLLDWTPVRFLLEIAELYFSKRVARSAAELAYFLVLSFFPVLICLNAFVGLLHLDIAALVEGRLPSCPGRLWTSWWSMCATSPATRRPAFWRRGRL